MSKYAIDFAKSFVRKYQKRIRNNSSLEKKIQAVVSQLKINPKAQQLATHKVESNKHGLVFSSRVTGDIRVIWNFDDGKIVITLLDIGGHSGKYKVYK